MAKYTFTNIIKDCLIHDNIEVSDKQANRLYKDLKNYPSCKSFEAAYGSYGYRLAPKLKMLSTVEYTLFVSGKMTLDGKCKNYQCIEHLLEDISDKAKYCYNLHWK